MNGKEQGKSRKPTIIILMINIVGFILILVGAWILVSNLIHIWDWVDIAPFGNLPLGITLLIIGIVIVIIISKGGCCIDCLDEGLS